VNRGHCWAELLQQCEPRSLLAYIVATFISDRIIEMMTLDTIVAFVILLVALLASTPMGWREEHLWNSSVLEKERFLYCTYLLI
jgi:hypothetical protein